MFRLFTIILAILATPTLVFAGENIQYLTIKDHKFTPNTVTVKANTKIKLVVNNQDATPEEFESHDLRREKIIPGNSKATFHLGPLQPGEYTFFGEFHEDTAQGKLIVQ